MANTFPETRFIGAGGGLSNEVVHYLQIIHIIADYSLLGTHFWLPIRHSKTQTRLTVSSAQSTE